jgi:histidyl-tRNA synthetase
MTPTFEHVELFVERSGPAILDEMYEFYDKGGRHLALRPELTAPVMRFYTNEMQRFPKPLKLYYFGPAYRYERPQRGRYREFWQMGLELIGADTPEATAEMISVAYDSMKNAGLKNFRLRIGDVRILRHFLDSIGKNDRDTMRAIDKRDSDLPEEIEGFISISDPAMLEKYGPDDEVDHYRSVLEILDAGGIDYVMDMGIARGLDYYTGVVFEIEAPELGAEKQICGGGEYRLAELFGANPVATSGFAIGFDRTLLALKKEGFSAPTHGRVLRLIVNTLPPAVTSSTYSLLGGKVIRNNVSS